MTGRLQLLCASHVSVAAVAFCLSACALLCLHHTFCHQLILLVHCLLVLDLLGQHTTKFLRGTHTDSQTDTQTDTADTHRVIQSLLPQDASDASTAAITSTPAPSAWSQTHTCSADSRVRPAWKLLVGSSDCASWLFATAAPAAPVAAAANWCGCCRAVLHPKAPQRAGIICWYAL